MKPRIVCLLAEQAVATRPSFSIRQCSFILASLSAASLATLAIKSESFLAMFLRLTMITKRVEDVSDVTM